MKKTKSGIVFEQGEIAIVPFPFTDLSNIKQRPVLVLSNNSYNRKSEDIITCGITSNLKNKEYSVLIDYENLVKGNIPTKSRIKVDKLFTLKKAIVRNRVAKVDEETMAEVKAVIQRII